MRLSLYFKRLLCIRFYTSVYDVAIGLLYSLSMYTFLHMYLLCKSCFAIWRRGTIMTKGSLKSVVYGVFSRLGIKINRLYKNNLFQFIFGKDKKALLELYNALNGTDYTDENEIEYVTIEGALYLTRKNDLAFLLSDTLNLYEHQSTINPNMPVRFLIYLSQEYQKILEKQKKSEYGSKQILLPTPKCIVFYNGMEEMKEEERIIRLTDAFKDNVDRDSDVELLVRIININAGFSEELKNKCRMLSEYSRFVQTVYEYRPAYKDDNEAINAAIDYCIENAILSDVLIANRAEVVGMLLTGFDVKKYEDTIREEGFTEGAASRQKEVDELKEANKEKDEVIADKDAEIADKDAEIADKDAEIERLRKKLEEIERKTS